MRLAHYTPDFDAITSPLAEDVENFLFAAFLRDEKHAFLRFAEQDLVGVHAGLTLRNAVHLDLDADATTCAHLASRTSEACGSHVLNANNRARLHGFEAGLEQKLFEKRIAHLNVGPLGFG